MLHVGTQLSAVAHHRGLVPLLVAVVLGMAVWAGVLPPGQGALQAQETRYTFLLGLQDKALRSSEGAQALEDRLIGRLNAAHLFDHRTRIDRKRGEVWVEVGTELSEEVLLTLLTGRGDAEFLPVARGGEVLGDLRGALPEGVELVYGRGARELDIYLYSADRATLEGWVSQLALSDYRMFVGPTGRGDVDAGFRSYLVARTAKVLGVSGLEAVQLHDGVFPNYHWVSAFWVDTERSEVEGRLAGRAGLQAMTGALTPGRMLLAVDGRVWATMSIQRNHEEGQLAIRVTSSSRQAQRDAARIIAAFLAGEVHPCDIVVVSKGDSAAAPIKSKEP